LLDSDKKFANEPTLTAASKSYAMVSNTNGGHSMYHDRITKNAHTTKSVNRSINGLVRQPSDTKSNADDIFSVAGKNRGMSQGVVENNRLASQFISKRLVAGQSLSPQPMNGHNRAAHTAFSGTGSQYGSIAGSATMYIKARQDDYWNKIANYNRKIYELEQEEAA